MSELLCCYFILHLCCTLNRLLLSELHDAYFKEPAHAQKVLAKLRDKQTTQTLPEVAEVCYLEAKVQFLPPCMHCCTSVA